MKPSTLAELTNRKLLLVLAYAPAGLGHLRVTDALYHGLPETVNPVVLGGQDTSIQSIHRLTSVNPVGKAVFDWLQGGPYSEQSNKLYRDSLRANHRDIYEQMTRPLGARLSLPFLRPVRPPDGFCRPGNCGLVDLQSQANAGGPRP